MFISFRAVLISLLVLSLTLPALSQSYSSGVIRVKFKEKAFQQIQSGRLKDHQFGISSVDQVGTVVGVTKIRRIFREAGRYEKAHQKFGLHLWYEIAFDEKVAVTEALRVYRQLPEFEIVEPCLPFQLVEPMNAQSGNSTKPASLIGPVNDPLFQQQWHYQNTGQSGGKAGADISLTQAWTIQTGNPEVVVAVIDGGIDILHPDLQASLWVNADEIAGNGIDDDHNGYVDDVNGYGFGDNTGTIHPNFHGTHVGGTIAAVTNNDVGVSGIAGGNGSGNGVRLMSCAGFGLVGVGGFEDAMVYAADNGAVISQNSWGGGSSAIEAAIDYFIARAGLDNSDENFDRNIQTGPMAGGIVIFAAGNSNTSDTSIGYPASYSPVMAVASTDHNDVRSYFSNYGSWVDIAAPGSDVYSTYPLDLGSYTYLSGTSMACPHVSGVAALIISQFKGTAYSPNEVWDRIQFTADDIDAVNPDYINLLGRGRLNAYQALQVADDIPPAAITSLAIHEAKLNSIILRWIAAGSSGNEGAASAYDLRYSTAPINAGNFSAATPVVVSKRPATAGTQEEFEVTGLTHNTTYYFALKSRDFFGNISSISNIISGKTLLPPVIGVTPGSIVENLFSGGSAVQYLTVSNTGASDLVLNVYSDMNTATGERTGAAVLQTEIKSGKNDIQQTAGSTYPSIEKNKISTISNDVGQSRITPRSGGHLFSLDLSSSSIIELDTETGAVIHSIDAPESLSGGPDGLAFDGSDLYFINSFGSKTIYKLHVETGEVLATLSLSELPYVDALAHSGKYLYALDYTNNEIFEIDFEAGAIVRTITSNIDLGGGMTFAGRRGSVFVSNFEYGIYEINLESGEVVNSFLPRGFIYGLGYSTALNVLFAANASTGVVDVYDVDTNSYLYSISGGATSALASDEAGNSWLDTSLSSATVAPGSSVIIPVNLNAAGLNGGSYTGQIEIRSNDPVTPVFLVPVTLHVTGAPNIVAGFQEINFGEIYTHQVADTTLVLTNTGTDNLVVSGISVTHSAFNVSTTPFSLVPGESEYLNVQFTPVGLTNYTADLILTSNDPDQGTFVISLMGAGVEPPEIHVQPLTIEADLISGQREVKTITIENTGGSALKWRLEFSENPEPTNISTSAKAGAYNQQHAVTSSFNNNGEKVSSDLTGPVLQAVGDFVSLPSSPTPLTCLTVDPVSGNIYAQANQGNSFFRYSPTTGEWIRLANCPIYSGNNGGAVFLNGEIFTVYTENSSQMGVYNISTNSWTTVGNTLATGNISTDGTYLYLLRGSEFKRYAPQSNVWTSLAAPPFTFEAWGGLSFYKNSFYGHQGNGYSGFARYDIVSNAWTMLQSVPGGAVLGSAMDSRNGVYYAYGSYGGSNFYGYTVETGTWSVNTIPLFSVNDGGMAYVSLQNATGIYFLQGEDNSGFARFETALHSRWLSVAPEFGEIPAGTTATIEVTLNAERMHGGTYEGTIQIQHNDPTAMAVDIPVTMRVTGAADLNVSTSAIAFGDVYIGAQRDSVLIVTNVGTDVLSVTAITVGNSSYQVNTEPFELLPDEQKEIQIIFRPSAPGTYNTTLNLASNDPDNSSVVIPLTGVGLFNPLAVTPASLQISLISGQEENRVITISNNGASTLTWHAAITGTGNNELADVLTSLNNNYDQVSASIPGRFDFYGGESGISISDGGGDMYDDGNFLTTDLAGGFSYIDYTSGLLIDDPRFGASGKYFTAKYPGLFVLAADATINTFTINGGLGADGSGNVDGYVLSLSRGGRNYKGFIKRVYNAWDPSVNHLIITEDNGLATHTYEASTNSDFHQLTGLAGTKRIYYLLFAANSGGYINNTAMQNIMEAFLDAVNEGASWVEITKKTGTLLPGGSEQVPVKFSALDMDGGDYNATMEVSDNLPFKEPVSIPVTLTVIGKPDIDLSKTVLNYENVYVGASSEKFFSLRNLGSDVLVVENIQSTDPRFEVSPTSFSLLPRDSIRVVVLFTPVSAGSFSGDIKITSNDPDEGLRVVTVSGNGTLPPVAFITPELVDEKVFQGDRKYVNIKIRNNGGDVMNWFFSDTGSIPFWATVSATGGQILGDQFQNLTLELDSKYLGLGHHAFLLHLNYNSPTNPVVVILVKMEVTQNHTPIVKIPIEDQIIELNADDLHFNLAANFMDEDDEPLVYDASASANVVNVTVLGSELTVEPLALGEADVFVWTADRLGKRADLQFHVTVEGVLDAENDLEYTNLRNYPNPFQTSTIIAYQLRKPAYVKLVVQDVTGGVIHTLVEGTFDQGERIFEYDGAELGSGLYFYQLFIDNKSAGLRKLIKY